MLEVLRQINEDRIIGATKGSKQLASIQRQDIAQEKLKERDEFQMRHLGRYEMLYPPVVSKESLEKQISIIS